MLATILSAILLLGGGSKSPARRRKRPHYDHRARLHIERLETRCVPASFTVNSIGDAGTGTGNSGDLRYCITKADSSDDTSSSISFDSTLLATTIPLTS
jgi:hypothetical protein